MRLAYGLISSHVHACIGVCERVSVRRHSFVTTHQVTFPQGPSAEASERLPHSYFVGSAVVLVAGAHTAVG